MQRPNGIHTTAYKQEKAKVARFPSIYHNNKAYAIRKYVHNDTVFKK